MPTELDALLQRMKDSKRVSHFYASKEYNAILDSLEHINRMQEQRVTKENFMEMLQYQETLSKSCETYLNTRAGAKTDKGKLRLELVESIQGLVHPEKLNQLRDELSAGTLPAMNWVDASRYARTAEVDLTGKTEELVGAGASSRRKIDEVVDGKRMDGFFTPTEKLVEGAAFVDQYIGKLRDPQKKDFFEQNRGRMQQVLDQSLLSMGDLTLKDPDAVVKMISETAQGNARDIAGFDSLRKDYVYDFVKAAKKNDTAMDHARRAAKIGVYDEKGLNTGAGGTAQPGPEIDIELSKRNVATSRMADLLGIGSLVARSVPMKVRDQGTVVEGTFMATAEGTDFKTTDFGAMSQFETATDLTDPEFQRQLTNIGILDVICGQVDRHGANMLYKLSPATGDPPVRKFLGIQGIDNDLAFGQLKGDGNKALRLNHITHVDRQMAENLALADRKMLDFALGDLLDKKEIDMVEHRMNAVKEQLVKHARFMEPKDWDAASAKDLSAHHEYFFNVGDLHREAAIHKDEIKEGAMEDASRMFEQAEKKAEKQAEKQAKAPKIGQHRSFAELQRQEREAQGKKESAPKWQPSHEKAGKEKQDAKQPVQKGLMGQHRGK